MVVSGGQWKLIVVSRGYIYHVVVYWRHTAFNTPPLTTLVNGIHRWSAVVSGGQLWLIVVSGGYLCHVVVYLRQCC